MKLPDKMPQPTGICRACGKSTRLLIHQECGKKHDAEMAEKIPGLGDLTYKHMENSNRKKAAKKYRTGKLPPWMLER